MTFHERIRAAKRAISIALPPFRGISTTDRKPGILRGNRAFVNEFNHDSAESFRHDQTRRLVRHLFDGRSMSILESKLRAASGPNAFAISDGTPEADRRALAELLGSRL